MAREHNLPAYLALYDATSIEMARTWRQSLAALPDVSGVGAKELEAEACEILRVLGQVG